MSIVKKLAGETAIYGLSSIVGRFLNYLLVPLYTSIFNPAEYGVSTWFYSLATFLGVLFTYGMETAFFRFSQKHEPKEEVFSTAMIALLVSSVVFGGLISVFSGQLATWVNYEGKGDFFIYLAIIMVADTIATLPFALLRQQGRPRKFAVLRLLSIGVNIILNLFIYLVLKIDDIRYMFIINAFSSVVVLPFLWSELKMLKFGFNSTLFREMLAYGVPVLFIGLAGMVNEAIDRLLLKELITDKSIADYQLGVYGANYKLAILITLFIQAFRFAAEPFFFARMKSQDAKLTYAKVMNYFVLVCSVIFLFVLFYLDIFKYFISKKAYWEGLKVVPILLFANVCLGIYYNLSIWYKLINKTMLGAYVSITGALITLVLNYLWIPSYGYMGAAWATLVCYATMVIISYFQGQKHYPVPYEVKRILFYLTSAVLLYWTTTTLTANIANLYLKLAIHTIVLFSYTAAIGYEQWKSSK